MSRFKLVLIAAVVGISFLKLDAQNNIGVNTETPDASAILDVVSSNKGVLLPRLSTTQRDAITTPAEGLLIFNTTTKSFNVFAVGIWNELDKQALTLSGNNLSIDNGNAIDLSTTNTDNQVIDQFQLNGTTLTLSIAGDNEEPKEIDLLGAQPQTYWSASGTDINNTNIGGVTIGGTATDPKAALDIQSNNKGVLVPRVNTIQMSAIGSEPINAAPTGLLVFNTDQNKFAFYDNGWKYISENTDWILKDADQDTKIQVEESEDEDKIRFDLGGVEHFVLNGPMIEVNNSGLSTFLGAGAGANNNNAQTLQNTFIGYNAGNQIETSGYNVAVGAQALSATGGTPWSYNTAIGYRSLKLNTGAANTAVGADALENNTSGENNLAIGYNALNANTNSSNNIAIGTDALKFNDGGESNIAIGNLTLDANTTGQSNVVVGGNAMSGSTVGDQNVVVGFGAGLFNTTGSGNVLLGFNAGSSGNMNNKLFIDNQRTGAPLLYGEFDNDLLRINGTLNINGDYSFPATDGAANQVLKTDGAGNITWEDDGGGEDQDWTINGNDIYNANSGNIGFGTSSPDQKFHFKTADDTERIKFEINNSATTQALELAFDYYGDDISLIGSFNNNTPKHIIGLTNSDEVAILDGMVNISDAHTTIGTSATTVYGDSFRVQTPNGISGSSIIELQGSNIGFYNTGKSIFIGEEAGSKDNLTDNENVFIGYHSGKENVNGVQNIAIGSESLMNNTAGGNTAIGYRTAKANTTGTGNTAIGQYAFQASSSGKQNVAIGRLALSNSRIGNDNVAIGYAALGTALNDHNNTAVGSGAIGDSQGGSDNTALGFQAGRRTAGGDFNLYLGTGAGYFNRGGSNNTIVGPQAGYGSVDHDISGSIFIGYQAAFNETNSNRLYIENSNSTTPLVYGEFDNDLVRINGDLEINGQLGSPIVIQGNATITKNIDWDDGNTQHITLGGNTVLTFSNGKSGRKYVLIIKQDGTGNRTVTWPTNVRFGGGGTQEPTLTTTANRTDYIGFIFNDIDNSFDNVSYRLNY